MDLSIGPVAAVGRFQPGTTRGQSGFFLCQERVVNKVLVDLRPDSVGGMLQLPL